MIGYQKHNFEDWPSKRTPVEAEELNEMEEGIFQAHEEIRKLSESEQNIVDTVYPIGSIYMSINPLNPGKIFGGVWNAFGNGRVIVGVDSEKEAYNEAEKTGGEDEIQLNKENLPEHNHGVSIEKNKGHYHKGKTNDKTVQIHNNNRYLGNTDGGGKTEVIGGTGEPVGMVQAEFMYDESTTRYTSPSWPLVPEHDFRTLTEPHYHSFETDSDGEHSHNVSEKNVGKGEKVSIMQPYITCYMWKRIS